MIVGTEEKHESTVDSLKRVQEFNAGKLIRADELGGMLSFQDAVEPAKNLIELFKRLSVSALEDFPDNVLQEVKTQSDNCYNLFSNILSFSPTEPDPASKRTQHIASLKNAYQSTFQGLHRYIAYSLHRSADFQRLDLEARATLQAVQDKADQISESLQVHEKDAKVVLAEIRKVAAEEGVTKQAIHFSSEYEHHSKEAETWRMRTL